MGLLFLGLSCGTPAPSDPAIRRLLVIGWDGATFDLIDPLISAGRMPVLGSLIERGQSAWLESSRVPISSAAWVGACTGQHPGETGVYDFFERQPDSYEVEVIDARSNLCPPIWRILSGRGRRVNILGVPITWPPEPVNGRLASGMLAPPAETWAFPAEYTDTLRDKGLLPDVGVWTKVRSLAPDEMLERIHEQLAIKAEVSLDLIREPDWDYSMIVFKSLDVLSHQRYDGKHDGVIADLLVRLDTLLGEMITAAGPDTDVIVMSDHGFGSFPYTLNLYPWLVQAGFASEQGENPSQAPGFAPLVVYEAQSESHRLERLDLKRTRVLASNTECEGNFGSLRLNLVGREPTGCVQPEDAEALLNDLEKALRAIIVAGEPLVTSVWRGSELYPGPANACVPDLVFETRADWQVVATAQGAALTEHSQPRPNHRLQGIFAAAGPSIQPSPKRHHWSVFDLTPTALHLLDQPLFDEMSGRAHSELLREERAVRSMPRGDDATLRPASEAWIELTDEQREAQLEQLKALGYAEGDEE